VELVLANVKLKLRVLVLRARGRIIGETILPRAVLDKTGLGLIKGNILGPRSPPLDLHADRVRLARTILGLRALAQETTLNRLQAHRRFLLACGRSEPFLLLLKSLVEDPLIKISGLLGKGLKLGTDLELNVKLGLLLQASRANLLGIFGARTNVPLEAHVLGRAELVGLVPRDIHPARLALVAVRVGLRRRKLKLGKVRLFKVRVRLDSRHL
jgi:hypothetical protein